MNDFDVAIVGGGAAGLSGALVLARAQRTVLIVDSGAPRNGPAAHMHGYLSRDGIDPRDLLTIGRQEVSGYGGTFASGLVTRASKAADGRFSLSVDASEHATARRLLVTTGLRDELPDIPGLLQRWGRDVLHCPYCHGHEVRGQRLGVLGGTPGSVRFAQIVRQWSDEVVIFVPRGVVSNEEREQLLSRSIGIVEGYVSQVNVEGDSLNAVEISDGRTVACDALFVPPVFVPNGRVLADLGCALDSNGWVLADATGMTSVPGVWVAGNVANPRAQVITAAGEGSAAAIAINADLVDEDVRTAVLAMSGVSAGEPTS